MIARFHETLGRFALVAVPAFALSISAVSAMPIENGPKPERTATPHATPSPAASASPRAEAARYIVTVDGTSAGTFASAQGLPPASELSGPGGIVTLAGGAGNTAALAQWMRMLRDGDMRAHEVRIVASGAGSPGGEYLLANAVIIAVNPAPGATELRLRCTGVNRAAQKK